MFLQTLFSINDPSLDPSFSGNVAFQMLLKMIFIAAGLLYLLFAFVVTRQIHIMKNTVSTPLSGVVLLIGYLHLFIALGVLFFFISL